MKRFVSILACIAMLLSVTALLAACDDTPDPSSTPATSTVPSSTPHTHAYGSIWQYDLENHWNECTCGEKDNVAAHVDADTDYKCDVCNCDLPQPPHEHSFGTEWKHDEENHWNECACGEKSNKAAHADADVNGKCDTCDADVPLPPHEHSFGTEWKHDEENHWNECTCGEKSNTAAHIDTDVNAKCDICDAEVPLPPHEHNFGTGWFTNEEKHWQECDCGEKSGEAAHADNNKDQKCDTCEYLMENASQGTTNTLVMGSNAIAKQDVVFTYTATENGTLTLTLTPPASSSLRDVLNVSYSVNGAAAVNLVKNTATDIAMKAGETITITVAANVDATINASWKADSAQGSGNTLVMGSNAIAKEDVVFTYTATENGTLTLTLTPPASSSLRDVLNVTYSVNGAAAVKLVNNTATDIAMKAGEVITVTVAANVDATLTAAWKADSSAAPAGDPLPIGTTNMTGEDVTYVFTATADGVLTLTSNKPLLGRQDDYTITSYTVNGGEAVTLTTGTATQITLKKGDVVVVTVSTNQKGTLVAAWAASAPATPAGDPLPIGTTNMTGEDVTYVYTAPADGVLTLTSNKPLLGRQDDYTITSYTVNGGEAVTLANATATEITLKKGDVVVITVSTNEKGTLVAAWTAGTPAVVNAISDQEKKG